MHPIVARAESYALQRRIERATEQALNGPTSVLVKLCSPRRGSERTLLYEMHSTGCELLRLTHVLEVSPQRIPSPDLREALLYYEARVDHFELLLRQERKEMEPAMEPATERASNCAPSPNSIFKFIVLALAKNREEGRTHLDHLAELYEEEAADPSLGPSCARMLFHTRIVLLVWTRVVKKVLIATGLAAAVEWLQGS